MLYFLFQEMKRRFCRAFISTEDLVGFEGDGWEVTQILSFFIIVERLPCKKLTNIAAKMTFLVNDIIRDPSKEMSQFLEFHRHIRPLHTFRSRWQKIKSTIEKGVHWELAKNEETSSRYILSQPYEQFGSQSIALWDTLQVWVCRK